LSDSQDCYFSHKIPDICVLSLNISEANEPVIKDFLETYKANLNFKIFVIISDSTPLTLKMLRDWGADACISKPFRLTDFEKKLAAIFQKSTSSVNSRNNSTNKEETLTRLDGLNILVAEDNAINAKLVETILLRSGATPYVVNTGNKAVAAFSKEEFDIILMDIHMPQMNGIDAARIIRETEEPSTHIPIIGLTAISQSNGEALSQNTDFDDILEKPIAVDELLHEISYRTHAQKSPASLRYTNHKPTHNLGIDKGLSTTLNEMLLRELPGVKKTLLAAFNSTDYRFLRGEIHRLLGGMAYCDFANLQKLTMQYQASLKTEGATMDENFQKMITEMDRLSNAKNS